MRIGRSFCTLGLAALVGSCSPTNSDDGGSGGAALSTGGRSSSESGGSTSIEPPVPTGPGLDASVDDTCQPIACDASRMGEWELTTRCDTDGQWHDEGCPSADYRWSVVSAEGTLSFDEAPDYWQVTTALAWTAEIPDECGGCDTDGKPPSSWDSVDCQEEAGGSCVCTGNSQFVQDWVGSVEGGVGDGNWTFKEEATAETVAAGIFPPFHEFQTCAGTTEMTVYDENGGRLRFRRVSD